MCFHTNPKSSKVASSARTTVSESLSTLPSLYSPVVLEKRPLQYTVNWSQLNKYFLVRCYQGVLSPSSLIKLWGHRLGSSHTDLNNFCSVCYLVYVYICIVHFSYNINGKNLIFIFVLVCNIICILSITCRLFLKIPQMYSI